MRSARKVSISGIVLLCISCFLPQVRGCKEDVVPILGGPLFLLIWGLPFVFAFFAAALFTARWLVKTEKRSRRVAMVACLFTALILAYACFQMIFVSVDLHREGLRIEEPLGLAAASALLAMYVASLVLQAKATPGVKMPACFLLCAFASLVYFVYMGAWLGPLWGLWFSILACLLIMTGSVLEIRQARKGAAKPP